MTKTFKEHFAEKFAPIGFGEKKFVAKHPVKEVPDFSNETEAQHKAKNKTYDRAAHRMGYNPGQDAEKYEDWDHGLSEDDLELIVDTMTVEEFEQLDELSKKTLANYISNSSNDAVVRRSNNDTFNDPKIGGRLRGVTKAAKKLSGQAKVPANEEAELTDLSELSKHTLVSYVNKAAKSAVDQGYNAGQVGINKKNSNKAINRVHGVTKAAGRLAYAGGHVLSKNASRSGITIGEGKTFKDSRKYFDDDGRDAMKKRLQARMQARKGEC